MKTIKTKNGFTSEYGFMCGYIETIQTEKTKLTMYYEHGIYHIQAYRNDLKRLMTRNDCKIWNSYETLTEAKKEYKKLVKIFTN
jgi:hypothetical protein